MKKKVNKLETSKKDFEKKDNKIGGKTKKLKVGKSSAFIIVNFNFFLIESSVSSLRKYGQVRRVILKSWTLIIYWKNRFIERESI